MSNPHHLAVIGAGIIGLSTAYRIKNAMKDVDITIFYAEKSPNTTANVAAGLLHPYRCDHDKTSIWWKQTAERMQMLHKRPDAMNIGISPLSGYEWAEEMPSYAPNTIQTIRDSEKEFLVSARDGYKYTSWICDCNRYLKFLEREYVCLGGKMVNKTIQNFEELKAYDVIINCAGIGAKQLANDPLLVPIRGQVIIVEAPWLKNFVMDEDFYVLPRIEDVVLGGTTQEGDFNLNVDRTDSQAIWEGCCKLEPSLKYSKFINDKVGLRPYRSQIRLDFEKVIFDGKNVGILHNYGHGGAGITLHWGCALDACTIVQKFLLENEVPRL